MAAVVDVIVIGAGVIGASVAYFSARAGLSVLVLDQGQIAGGTSSSGEGNILVSDKELGPELELAMLAQRVWREDLAEYSALWEFESKGGLVVAASEDNAASLAALTTIQRSVGIEVENLPADRLGEWEPRLSPDLVAGAFYPQDAQVQPMLVAGQLLRLARGYGAQLHTGVRVINFLRAGERVNGVETTKGSFMGGNIVNAAGTWAGEVATLAGVEVPVLPRRGFILVTQPTSFTIRHKVYSADYVDNVASSAADLQSSPVIESTPSGTILIGSTRERVGFDHSFPPEILALLAAKAIALFPGLAQLQIMRHYHGFRPYCPDHLPVIGADPRAPGLFHACGHEGAGIGLSTATGLLIAQLITGMKPAVDVAAFAPERFETGQPVRGGETQ